MPVYIKEILDHNADELDFFVGKAASRIPTLEGTPSLKQEDKTMLKKVFKQKEDIS